MWGHSTREARGRRVAYLVVLDGEHDESMGVLPENWLVELLWLQGGGPLWLLWLADLLGRSMLHIEVLGQGGDCGVLDVVLLVCDAEVELLDWGVHLQGLNARCSLWRLLVSLSHGVALWGGEEEQRRHTYLLRGSELDRHG